MKRRDLVLGSLAIVATGAAMADLPKVQSLDDAQRWLERLERAAAPKSTGAWPLAAVLEHLAQSIDMSLDGYPQSRGALFHNTAGAAAFSFFKWRGRMSHGLDEPIPGAPALAMQADWKPAAVRLRGAIRRFETHAGALRPHFAYGALDKGDFARAHSMHIANHQDEILLA
ncbi:MAG TPA: DUF1569 domain-containing protein [Ramlibacter sp.]|nr:DUF1569 domain-containing protein [Ramlibacter sp.]